MGRNTRNKKDSRSSKSFNSAPQRSFTQNRSFSSAPRDMHKAKCSECQADCEVPFTPTEGKPVYCRECYRKKKSW